MARQNYTLKFIILFLATFAGILAIWYSMIRQESADWITSQVVHQVSPYAVTATGQSLIVSNVVAGYEFVLPGNFQTSGARNLILWREQDGRQFCLIKHYYIKPASAARIADNEYGFIKSAGSGQLVFELVNQAEKDACQEELEAMKLKMTVS